MSEKEWLTHPHTGYCLSTLLPNHADSLRKARLYAIACCRTVWELLPTDDCRTLVGMVEDYVEGKGSWKAVTEQREKAAVEGRQLYELWEVDRSRR